MIKYIVWIILIGAVLFGGYEYWYLPSHVSKKVSIQSIGTGVISQTTTSSGTGNTSGTWTVQKKEDMQTPPKNTEVTPPVYSAFKKKMLAMEKVKTSTQPDPGVPTDALREKFLSQKKPQTPQENPSQTQPSATGFTDPATNQAYKDVELKKKLLSQIKNTPPIAPPTSPSVPTVKPQEIPTSQSETPTHPKKWPIPSSKFFDQLGSNFYKNNRVSLSDGTFYYTEPLMSYEAEGIDYDISLYYKTSADYKWMLGNNWGYAYEVSLHVVSDSEIDIHSWSLKNFKLTNDGTGFFIDSADNMEVRETHNQDNVTYVLTMTLTGDTYTFHGKKSQTIFLQDTITHVSGNKIEHMVKDGKFQSVTDAKGKKTIMSYNENSQLIKIIDPKWVEIKFDHFSSSEDNGTPQDLKSITFISKDGVVDSKIDYTYYKSTHLLHTVKDPASQFTLECRYDEHGKITYYKTRDGLKTYSYTLNPATGKVLTTSLIDREWENSRYTFDERGNVIKEEVINGDKILTYKKEYDAQDRVIKFIQPLGDGGEFIYGDDVRISEVKIEGQVEKSWGDTLDLKYIYEGDSKIPKSVILPDGSDFSLVNFKLNPFTFYPTMMELFANIMLNSSDNDGKFNYIITWPGSIQKVWYSEDNKIQKLTALSAKEAKWLGSLAGQWKDLYDGLLRTIKEGNQIVYTGKDKNGRLNQIIYDDEVKIFYKYNKFWVLEKEVTHLVDDSEETLSYQYDDDLNIVEQTSPSGKKIKYTRDSLGRIVSITDNYSNTVGYVYGKGGLEFTSVTITDTNWKNIPQDVVSTKSTIPTKEKTFN